GAMHAGQRSVPYVASMQEVQLVDAYTLKPDGRRIAVDRSAIQDQPLPGLPQLPMFTDQRMKVIIFPQVAAGDTIVYTTKIKTKQPYFPGQFMFADVFARTVAFNEVRETITAPKSLALNAETHGIGFSKQE